MSGNACEPCIRMNTFDGQRSLEVITACMVALDLNRPHSYQPKCHCLIHHYDSKGGQYCTLLALQPELRGCYFHNV